MQVAQVELRQKLMLCSPGLLWLALMFAKSHKVGIITKVVCMFVFYLEMPVKSVFFFCFF